MVNILIKQCSKNLSEFRKIQIFLTLNGTQKYVTLPQIDQSVLMHITINRELNASFPRKSSSNRFSFSFVASASDYVKGLPLIYRGLLVEEIANHRLAQSVKANKPSISSGIRNETRFCSRVLRNKSRGVFGEQWCAEIVAKVD